MENKHLKPCPICKTAEPVYVVPGIINHEKLSCICNLCGLGETLEFDTAKEAEFNWNQSIGEG